MRLLEINACYFSFGMQKLLALGAYMDRLMKAGRVGSSQMIKHNCSIWSMKDNGNLINDLKRRGVDDEDAFPNYHYRDDAILLWNTIHNYVSTIVSGYYSEYGLSFLHVILSSQKITVHCKIQSSFHVCVCSTTF